MIGDTTEAIYEQLMTLLGAISGVSTVWRDRGDIPNDNELPAIILLDGRETTEMDIRRTKSVKDAPKIMDLQPEVVVVLYPRATKQNLTIEQNGSIIPAPVGPELSAWRMKIRTAVINDPGLIAIIGGDRGEGQIIYEGYTSDMEQGGSMYGSMLLRFCIRYPLFPPQA